MRFKAALVVLVLAGAAPALAWAGQIFESYISSAPALEIDPSTRSAGMAGASSAMTWGADPNYWANPALLGYTTGVRYEEATANYDLGMRFITQRTALGYGGLGVATAARPFNGLGQLKLRYPTIDVGIGSPVGGYERIRSWSAGVSVAKVVAEIAQQTGRTAPPVARYADLAFGYSERRVNEVFTGGYSPTPGVPPPDQDAGHVVVRDWGVLARLAAPLRLGRVATGRLEGAYGFSIMNFEDAGIDVFATGHPIPGARDTRNGIAARVALDPARGLPRLPAWFAHGLEPLVSLGGALDLMHTTAGAVGSGGHDADAWGGELALANVVFARMGRSRSTDGAAQDAWGLGFGLPVGPFGGFRYDRANRRIGDGLADVKREGWSAWLDPVAIYRSLR